MRALHRQVAVAIPLAYHRVLRSEAEIFGLRPSQFAEMLVRQSVGLPALGPRPAQAPVYTFGDEELRQREKFVWTLHRDLKRALDQKRIAVGLRPQDWLVTELNRWIGRPSVEDLVAT